MDSPWDFVLQFQGHSNPTLQDYVALDAAMDTIRAETDMESRLAAAGFSQKFCRFQREYAGFDDKETLHHLKRHYRVRAREAGVLQRWIGDLERKVQKACTHTWEKDWEARDHRSRYTCTTCGAYR